MRAKEFTINIPINIKINDDGDPEVSTDQEPIDDNVGDFVPPLQKKIELMKKTAGVESVYDDDEDGESTSEAGEVGADANAAMQYADDDLLDD